MSVDGLNLSVKSISIHRIIPQYWWSRISYAISTGHIEKAFANLCALPVDAVFKARYNKTEEKKSIIPIA